MEKRRFGGRPGSLGAVDRALASIHAARLDLVLTVELLGEYENADSDMPAAVEARLEDLASELADLLAALHAVEGLRRRGLLARLMAAELLAEATIVSIEEVGRGLGDLLDDPYAGSHRDAIEELGPSIDYARSTAAKLASYAEDALVAEEEWSKARRSGRPRPEERES